MKSRNENTDRDQVLQFLSAAEIDDFILGRLLQINGLQNLLVEIAEGSTKASTYQRRNAIHVLGRLGEAEAIPHLLTAFNKCKAQLRVHVLAALGRIGPDEKAQALMKDLVHDEKAKPAEIAYALQALTKSTDKAVFDDLMKHPPVHREDSGVQESFARFRAKARNIKKVPAPKYFGAKIR